ncbi:L,D-transpeptidase [Catellatospora citrea]|uniref:L,D-TPase catalytic domain-containing protein n=1 Tax=Catellatospora citrea TaxID=53366 RepID=A0A8J3NY20_9ACTN|nr:L,D-transpeptidase [Catellatospora citrea]GIF96882.1 hypothetical protein Cci01nite_19760 [Catellatospora citrea]
MHVFGPDPIAGVSEVPAGLIRPYLVFNGQTLTVFDRDGNALAEYPATSGRPGTTSLDQASAGRGPLPEGSYHFDAEDFSPSNLLRQLTGDWGEWRVPLTPATDTDTHDRDGFFLHGGRYPGSAGCIDVGEHISDVQRLLNRAEGPIEMAVNYHATLAGSPAEQALGGELRAAERNGQAQCDPDDAAQRAADDAAQRAADDAAQRAADDAAQRDAQRAADARVAEERLMEALQQSRADERAAEVRAAEQRAQ